MVDTRLYYGNAWVSYEPFYYKTLWCFFCSWCLWSKYLIGKGKGYINHVSLNTQVRWLVHVIFCGLCLSLWMEKSLTCLHYKAYPNFPKGMFHRESNTCYILFMSQGQEGPLNPSTQMRYNSGIFHRPWEWRACHFGKLPQIKLLVLRTCCSHSNEIPWLCSEWSAGLLHTEYYIMNTGHYFLKRKCHLKLYALCS